jgi:hypothetical protein
LAAALRLLGEAADALRALVPGDLPDGALADALMELDARQNVLDAACVQLTGVWDTRMVWSADGARSGATWLATHTELARPAAGSQIRLARALRTMPHTDAAFADGRLGAAKVRLLTDAAEAATELFARDELMLVDQAVGLTVAEVGRVLAFWKAHANPDGAADTARKQHEDRAFHLSESFQGMWLSSGKFTPEGGELLRDELDRRARARYLAEKAEADAAGLPVRSTAAQRRMDALIEMALQSAAATDDGTPINTPSITAVIDLTKLADPATAPTDVVGETAAGTPVPAATAERWTCDCSISRLTATSRSTPVDLGRTARLPSPAQRRALAVRDRCCTFPGCDQRASWTNAHHLVHWVHGGSTDLSNLALLCPFHHHRVHEGGYGVARDPGGQLEFTRPDGTVLTVPKRRAPDPGWPRAA